MREYLVEALLALAALLLEVLRRRERSRRLEHKKACAGCPHRREQERRGGE